MKIFQSMLTVWRCCVAWDGSLVKELVKMKSMKVFFSNLMYFFSFTQKFRGIV